MMPQESPTLHKTAPDKKVFITDKESLCTTCLHSPRCSLHKQNKEHVLECNEFDTKDGLKKISHTENLVYPGMKSRAILDLRLGLCATCLSKTTCTYERPDTGVWHCEEYK